MSPTEAELRAFLHDGEGDVPDAASAISQALRVRYERRRRVTTVLSSAAVIAVVATGLTFLFTRQSDDSGGAGGSAGAAAGGSAPLAHSARSAHRAPAVPSPAGSSAEHGSVSTGTGSGGGATTGFSAAARIAQAAVARIGCPQVPASLDLPGGGGLSTYGAKQPMFADRPAGMKVCAYSLVSRSAPKDVVLSAGATQTLARVIEKSSPVPGPTRMCPDRPADANRRIQIIAVDAAGHRLRTVTITLQTCGPARVTNGTSVRYLDRFPAAVRKLAEPKSTPR